MTAPSPAAPKRQNWTSRLPMTVRSVHLYLSITASLCIAFFALSGLVANLAKSDSQDQHNTVPPAALESPTALAAHLQTVLDLPSTPKIESIGDQMYAAAVDLGEERLEISVYRTTSAMEVVRWRALPADLPIDRASLVHWLEKRVSGHCATTDDQDDPAATRIELRMESVWQVHAITIDRTERQWGMSTTQHGVASILIDLHKGRYASWWQHLLMDVIAIILLLSVVTGIILGLVWASRTRRMLIILSTILGGLLCLIALIAGR
ncbi:MAG: PepSY-associated TM helix domain-containing protein [Planctomycetota bacterium]